MKRSNLFLGATAFVLAIAGAFSSKAAKTHHQQTVYTNGSGTCTKYSLKNGLTAAVFANHTFKTGGSTAFTKNCSVKLRTLAD